MMMKTVHTGLHQQIAGENDEVKDDKADEDSTPSHRTLHKHIGTVDPGRCVASHRVNRSNWPCPSKDDVDKR